MDKFAWRRILSPAIGLGIAGALIGLLAQLVWDNYLHGNRSVLFGIGGGVIGVLFLPVYHWIRANRRGLFVEEIEVPLFGLKLKVKLSEAHRGIGWRLFVESATRITTQRVEPDEGFIREALTSLYKLFEIVRTELKALPPSEIIAKPGEDTVESYALRMLNDGLRQMLSRWHPRLSAWEKSGKPESAWPLAEYCRRDLESTRQIILEYTWGLGEIIKVPQLAHLLPGRPAQRPVLTPIEDVRRLEEPWTRLHSNAQRTVAWHIFVELKSRISSQPLAPGTGLIAQALSSLHQLFEVVRAELKTLSPVPAPDSPEASVEAISLSMLNEVVRPFLASWQARLVDWEKKNPNSSEGDWPENETCRAELEQTRSALVGRISKLGELVYGGHLPAI